MDHAVRGDGRDSRTDESESAQKGREIECKTVDGDGNGKKNEKE